jgi:hypothetical protein
LNALTAPVIVLAVVATGLQVCIVSYAILRVTIKSINNVEKIWLINLIAANGPDEYFLLDCLWFIVTASSICVLRYWSEIKRPGKMAWIKTNLFSIEIN